MESNILIDFLFLLSILFLIPKLFLRIKIPSVTTEIILGFIFASLFPFYVQELNFIDILASIGIISFFIYSGIEADVSFIKINKRIIIESILIRLFLLLFISIIIFKYFPYNLKVSSLIALALITPSAGFVLTNLKDICSDDISRKWVISKVLMAEITFIFLMIIFLNIDNLFYSIFITILILFWIFFFSNLIETFYFKIFKKVEDVEFPFLFLIGFISAIFTHILGVHFILGAFIAGMFIENFLMSLKKDFKLTHIDKEKLVYAFKFIYLIFLPFYFFTVGINLSRGNMNMDLVFTSIIIFIIINSIRFMLHFLHIKLRLKRTTVQSSRMAIMILPTVIFTAIIADTLYSMKMIGLTTFSILILYALFSSFIPLLARLTKK